MAVSLVGPGSTTGNTALASSRAVPVPNNGGANPLQANDVVVVTLSRWESTNPAVTTPGGWIARTQGVNGSGKINTYLKRLTGADTGTYTFSWSGSMWTTGQARAYRGVDPAADLSTIPFATPTTNSGTSWPAITLSGVGNGVLDWHGYSESNGNPHTQPTGFTKLTDNDSDVSAYQLVSAGSFTTSGGSAVASSNNIATLLHLPEASTGAAMTLGAAAGTGAAQALALGKAETFSAATGTGAAQALDTGKALPLGAAAGTGAPQAMTFTKGLAFGTATGSGAAAGITDAKGLDLATAAGTGAPQVLTPGKDLGLQVATGLGAPQVMTFTGAGSLALGPATGAGTPQPMTFAKGLAFGAATGLGAAQALVAGKAWTLGAAAGAGSPRALAAGKALALGAAQGFGTPFALELTGPLQPFTPAKEWTAVTRYRPMTARTRQDQEPVHTRVGSYSANTREIT